MSGTGAINITPFCELRIAPWPLEMPDIYQTSTTTPASSGLIIDEDWSLYLAMVFVEYWGSSTWGQKPHMHLSMPYIYIWTSSGAIYIDMDNAYME